MCMNLVKASKTQQHKARILMGYEVAIYSNCEE